ncbi:MAG: glutathione S-transferase [Alphaproteobacteria bacterium]|nr:glutathione S-transferase [Alphaproteobacteria bacterium]
MLVLHHLNNSRSQRLLWLLEEINADYELRKYLRDPETMRAPDSLRAVHPLGKSPLLSDGDEVIAESAAIIEYIIDTQAPHLRPEAGTPAYRDYVYWMHFAEGTLMTPLLIKLMGDRIAQARVPFFVKPVVKGVSNQLEETYSGPENEKNLAFVDAHLDGREWFCGDALTGADFQMSFPLEAASARIPGFSRFKNIASYLDRIHARPAYQRGLEKGDPYDFA